MMLLNSIKAMAILVLCMGIAACDNDEVAGNQAGVAEKQPDTLAAKVAEPSDVPVESRSEMQTSSDEAMPPPVIYIEPIVDDLIKKASDHLAKAESFSVSSSVHVDEVFPNGQMIQLAKNTKVLVRRPDRLQAEVISDKGNIQFYYNGKTITRFDLKQNTYANKALIVKTKLSHLDLLNSIQQIEQCMGRNKEVKWGS